MVAKAEQRLVRPMSNVERWQTALHLLGAYYGTTVACRYTIPASLRGADQRPQLKSLFDRALVRTVLQHPFLRVTYADEDSKCPYWIEIDGLDLANHVEWSDESDFEGAYQKRINEYLDNKFTNYEEVPGWKMTLYRRSESELVILMVWNHTAADGVSGRIFHRTLLTYLNDPATTSIELPFDEEKRYVKATATAEDLPPPQENIAKYTLSIPFMASLAWREAIYPMITGDQSGKAAWAPLRTTPYETHIATALLAAAPLAKVLTKCREHKTTLTGLLHGIALVFFAKFVSPDKAKSMGSQTPLDQRRHTPPNSEAYPNLVPKETIANYVSIVMHNHDAATLDKIRALPGGSGPEDGAVEDLESIMWSSATSVRNDIEGQLAKGTKDDFTGLMNHITDLRKFFKGELAKPRGPTWLVSNVGVLDGTAPNGDVENNWSIHRATFTLSAFVNGPVVKLNVASAKGGELAIDVTWQAGVIEDADGQRLAREIEAWLKHFGDVKA